MRGGTVRKSVPKCGNSNDRPGGRSHLPRPPTARLKPCPDTGHELRPGRCAVEPSGNPCRNVETPATGQEAGPTKAASNRCFQAFFQRIYREIALLACDCKGLNNT